MKTKKIYFTLIFICISIFLNAQTSGYNLNRIGIGDKVPEDLPLVNLVNYPNSEAKISDFKGKWLILDYWFTGCGPCIASWPKLMHLQEKYGDKIQIMGVNHMQNKEVVEDFITRRNKRSKEPFTIPSVTGDTILYKILPPSGYPTVIWIDPEGVYRASTNGEDLNDENILKVLNNKGIKSLAVNTTFINLKRPLFIDGNGGTGQQMLYYSTISKYSERIINGAFLMSADSSGYVIAATHKPIIDLISRAYCKGPYNRYSLVDYIRLPQTQIELKVKNQKKLLFYNDPNVSLNENIYTYQLISYEPRKLEELKQIMRDDLQKYFNLEFQWEKRRKQCLVLKAKDTTLLGDNVYKTPIYGYKKVGSNFYLKDVPVFNFFGYLTEYVGGIYNEPNGYPLIDETGYKGGLDIIFENVTDQNNREILRDYKKLNIAMSKYKLSFSLEEREVSVLVITDSKPIKENEFHTNIFNN
ncbi:MAG TPA: TlpA disulfide reductase family protein [Flavobacteriaceae bacterium]